MRKKIVAGNWKMNETLQEGVALAKEINGSLKAEKPNCDVVICTPFIHLASVAEVLDAEALLSVLRTVLIRLRELTQVRFLPLW